MNTPRSRRQFLASSATLAAAAALGLRRAEAQPAEAARTAAAAASSTPSPARPGAWHVFSKPFHGLGLRETADLIAEAGFGGMDWTVRGGGHVLPERAVDDLPRAVDAARAAGLRVDMIVTGITSVDSPHARPLLETAARLGIRHYRLGFVRYDWKRGVLASLAAWKPILRDLAQLNADLGLHGAIQNHSGLNNIGALGWELHELLRDHDPRWLGCQYDIRHAVTAAGQSWPVTLELLQPWVRTTAWKDFRWRQTPGKLEVENVPLGEGVVDFPEYLAAVRRFGIGGPRSVHFEYPPFEGGPALAPAERRPLLVAGLRRDLAALKRLHGESGG